MKKRKNLADALLGPIKQPSNLPAKIVGERRSLINAIRKMAATDPKTAIEVAVHSVHQLHELHMELVKAEIARLEQATRTAESKVPKANMVEIFRRGDNTHEG